MHSQQIRDGIRNALPIALGYFPVSITFGILAKNAGLDFFQATLFSVLNLAGASQFMAISLISSSAQISGILIATFLINFRYVLMSAAITHKIEEKSISAIPFFAFGITDEVFSVSALRAEPLTKQFMFALVLVSYFGWIAGTIFGYLIGETFPPTLNKAMIMGLYGMFIAILVPIIKNSLAYTLIALLSAIFNSILKYLDFLPAGWSIIVSILLASTAGIFILEHFEKKSLRENEKHEDNEDNEDCGYCGESKNTEVYRENIQSKESDDCGKNGENINNKSKINHKQSEISEPSHENEISIISIINEESAKIEETERTIISTSSNKNNEINKNNGENTTHKRNRVNKENEQDEQNKQDKKNKINENNHE